MKEWVVRDEVFPFVCGNNACGKEFSYNEFFVAAVQWGYICLTDGEHNFIGLTCPECSTTSIQKYSLAQSNEVRERMGFMFSSYVPYSMDRLPGLNAKENGTSSHVPEDIQLLRPANAYPQWFLDGCLSEISEADIESVVNLENEHREKIFPRVVAANSVYELTDALLALMKDKENPIDNLEESGLIVGANQLLGGAVAKHYLMDAKTSITKAEYQDLTVHFLMANEYTDDFVKGLRELLVEYAPFRERIDFELVWKTELFDRYIKRFYHCQGYFKSPQFFQDKWAYEEIFGKISRHISDSQADEIMTCQEVTERLGVEPIKLQGFIKNLDLPAYHPDWRYFDPHEKSPQELLVDPEKLIYLKSEIDEFVMRHSKVIGSNQVKAEPAAPKDPAAEKAAEFARLIFEENKWQSSIDAAVQLGLHCEAEKPEFNADALIDFLDQIDNELPVSAIEAIWEGLPAGYKQDSAVIETPSFVDRRQKENARYAKGELNDIESRQFPLKKRKTDTRKQAIQAGLKTGMFFQNFEGRMKRNDLADKIEELGGSMTQEAVNKIIKCVPTDFRYGSGNPRDPKEEKEQ